MWTKVAVPTFLVPGTDFAEDNFSMDCGFEMIQCITFIVYLVCIIIPVPPQIIKP